jgi:hypothetical protein
LRHARVGRQQRNAFDEALRDEQSIERISMQRRQTGDRDGVLAGNWQFLIAVTQQIAPQRALFEVEIAAPLRPFYWDLPEACRTE